MPNPKEDQELITMGMNLGLYTFAKFFSKGMVPSPRMWEIMSRHLGAELEKQTGMPAEDLASRVEPVLQDMMDMVQDKVPRNAGKEEK